MSRNLSQYVAGEVRAGLARERARPDALAKALNMSQATLARRLSGDSPFDVAELGIVADFLKMPLSALLPGAEAVA